MSEGKRSDWAWIGALWISVALFFFRVLFGGESFFLRDTIIVYYPQAKECKP